MAGVLFAHGHLLRFDRKQWEIGKPYPPLATITAAAYLRSLGHEVALFDPMLDEDTSGFEQALRRSRPDVVVLYDDVFNWFTKMCLGRMRQAALGMIAKARAAGARVVVSGHDAADEPEAYLAAGADYVVVGEAEITLGELLGRLVPPAPQRPGSTTCRASCSASTASCAGRAPARC
jgi:anaerobic magnesium-protoporphyrin IX monomethyl ester cyclase